ncbi:MAG TPA: hypothetical protein VF209_01920 [Patescibacteria group bacterium]
MTERQTTIYRLGDGSFQITSSTHLEFEGEPVGIIDFTSSDTIVTLFSALRSLEVEFLKDVFAQYIGTHFKLKQ